MHSLGGLWVGGMGVWIFFEKRHTRAIYFIPVFLAVIVGLGYEFFEFTFDLVSGVVVHQKDTLDTITDLGADTAGGLFASLLTMLAKRKV